MRDLARRTPGGVTQLAEHDALLELATARQKLRVAEAAAATGDSVLTRVEAAMASTPASPDLATFLTGVVKHTTVNRVAENGTVNLTALLKAAALPPATAGGARSRIFLGSLVAGGMLSQVRQEVVGFALRWEGHSSIPSRGRWLLPWCPGAD
jgi:autotransporter adhesin